MKNYKFIIKESPEYIYGEIFYKSNEFIFESKHGNGEFSLMIEKNDWRLQGQEEYLKGETLYYKKYTKYSDEWEHEHCEFCGDKISEYDGDLHEGYCTKDEKCWICEKCFNDFKKMFDWKVEK